MKSLKDTLFRGKHRRTSSLFSIASATSTASTDSVSSTKSTPASPSAPPSSFPSAVPALTPLPPSKRISHDSALVEARRAGATSRLVNMEGWLSLGYGEVTKTEVLQMLKCQSEEFTMREAASGSFSSSPLGGSASAPSSPVSPRATSPQPIQTPFTGIASRTLRPFWFQLVGGFLLWFPEEPQAFHAHQAKAASGKIDLKNELHEVGDITAAEGELPFFSLTTKETVHRKIEETCSGPRGSSFTKRSVRQITEKVEYLLSSPDLALLEKWRDAILKGLKRLTRPASVEARAMAPLPPPSSASPDSSPRLGAARDTDHRLMEHRSRMVKQHGYLDLETRVELGGQTNSSTRTFWFELMGGYLHWYLDDTALQLQGRLQIKAGDAEVGEVETSPSGLSFFTLSTTEQISRVEERIADHSDLTILKTALKKQRTSLSLYSSNSAVLHQWRAQISAMARRRIMSGGAK